MVSPGGSRRLDHAGAGTQAVPACGAVGLWEGCPLLARHALPPAAGEAPAPPPMTTQHSQQRLSTIPSSNSPGGTSHPSKWLQPSLIHMPPPRLTPSSSCSSPSPSPRPPPLLCPSPPPAPPNRGTDHAPKRSPARTPNTHPIDAHVPPPTSSSSSHRSSTTSGYHDSSWASWLRAGGRGAGVCEGGREGGRHEARGNRARRAWGTRGELCVAKGEGAAGSGAGGGRRACRRRRPSAECDLELAQCGVQQPTCPAPAPPGSAAP